MQLRLKTRTFRDDLAELPLRRIISVFCLIAAVSVLAVRVRHLRSLNQVELAPRAEKLAVLDHYSKRVLSYAEQYGRPVFAWTGVRHSSAAESTLYENLRLDLRDERIRYWYGDERFTIAWWDPRQGRSGRDVIAVSYPWPREAAFYAHVRWIVNHPVPPRVRKPFADGQVVK